MPEVVHMGKSDSFMSLGYFLEGTDRSRRRSYYYRRPSMLTIGCLLVLVGSLPNTLEAFVIVSGIETRGWRLGSAQQVRADSGGG